MSENTQPQERDDLIERLEALSRRDHDDLSVADEAIIEIRWLKSEITRLRAQPSPREEHGWVIEGAWSDPATPQYWAGSSLWMSDHMCAIRFAREHDAEQAASAMLDGMNIRICEHVWSGDDIRENVSGENIRQSVSASPRMREALMRVNHTLYAHGKVDANTDLHGFIEAALASDGREG